MRCAKFDTDHQPLASHILYELVAVRHLGECVEQPLAFLRGVLSQCLRCEHVQGGEPCTTARSIRSNTLSKIHLRVASAPTGTCPPDNDLARSTMSGSIPQCSM